MVREIGCLMVLLSIVSQIIANCPGSNATTSVFEYFPVTFLMETRFGFEPRPDRGPVAAQR